MKNNIKGYGATLKMEGYELPVSIELGVNQAHYNIWGSYMGSGCAGQCQICKVGGTCFCVTGLCDKCYKEESERIAKLKDSDFKPFGGENREAVWENQDNSVVVYHYWDKYSQYGYPIGMPRSPYYEKWELEAKIYDGNSILKLSHNFDSKEKAVETARKINKGEVSISIEPLTYPRNSWLFKIKDAKQ